jgi:hypothetical protein
VQLALLIFMCLFSLIGLLISLRLKVELEECLAKLQALSTIVEPQRALRLQLYGSLAPSRSSLLCKYKFEKSYSHGKCIRMGWVPARSPRPVYGSPAPVKVVRKNELGAARRFLFCGSTVDRRRRAKDVAG